MVLTVRRAKPSDKVPLFKWRNDPRVWSNFLNPGPITVEEHDQWFQTIGCDSENLCFIGLLGSQEAQQLIGYCRFDRDSDTSYLISIMIIPEFQGRNLALELLERASVLLEQIADVPVQLQAIVKEDNLPSLRLFEKANFHYEESSIISTRKLVKRLP